MVLVLERAGVATAAAAQRMRGLPEPVGLGTERQHMFMASFLPPLPSFSLPLACSLSITLIFPYPLFSFLLLSFVCPGITCGRARGAEIKGRLGFQHPPRTAHHVSLMPYPHLLTKTHTHSSLSFCHLAYDQRIWGAAGNKLWLCCDSMLNFWCLSKGWSPAPRPVPALHKLWLLSKHVRTNLSWILLNW